MRRICNILAVCLTVILYASCEAGPPMSDQMAGMPVISGKITDMEGTPLEHIKVSVSVRVSNKPPFSSPSMSVIVTVIVAG